MSLNAKTKVAQVGEVVPSASSLMTAYLEICLLDRVSVSSCGVCDNVEEWSTSGTRYHSDVFLVNAALKLKFWGMNSLVLGSSAVC